MLIELAGDCIGAFWVAALDDDDDDDDEEEDDDDDEEAMSWMDAVEDGDEVAVIGGDLLLSDTGVCVGDESLSLLPVTSC